jgi:ABC-type multidrug transport system ATPase subunit
MRIELQHVTKSFGSVRALADISATVNAGERVVLVGPNGSGKSTLVRAVMGMVRCQGVVRLDGLDPFVHRMRLAMQLAYVPQATPHLGATVDELVEATARLRLLDRAAIRDTAGELALDLDAIGRRPVRALSGGTRQKLLITLAFAGPFSLLILDEPTASLDGEAREAFFRLFQERADGATLLLSSHRLDEVRRLVDRVIALEDGAVVLDARVSSPEVARQLHRDAWWQGVRQMARCSGGDGGWG